MKRLQDYILEELEYNNEINEGKIWNAIKKWWNNLFYSSGDKTYDRYSKDFDSDLCNEYVTELKNKFSLNNIRIKKIVNNQALREIVNPNGVKPDIKKNTGFTDFIDETISKDYVIYGISYITDDISDTAALIKVKNCDSSFKEFSNYLEILKIQIINEFTNVLSVNDILNKFAKSIINDGFIYKYNDKNKELYNVLLDECNFNKTRLNDNIKVVYKKIAK